MHFLTHLVKTMRSRKWCYEQTKHVELIRLDQVSYNFNMFVSYLCAYQNQGKASLNNDYLPLDVTFVVGV